MTYQQLERWSHLRSTNPVVVNHKKQYPNWPKHKAIPQSSKAVGIQGLTPESGIFGLNCNFPRII
jgi:uncharacterized protein YbdZ (MbtH family)